MQNRLKVLQPERIKWILFGSPDRIISTISLILGAVSLGFSIFVYKYPSATPPYIVTRDLLLIIFLVLMIVVLSIKYYKKDELVEQFRVMLSNQLVYTHQLIDKFSDHFFLHIRYNLFRHEDLSTRIDDIGRHYFNSVCHSILTDTRKLFRDYFISRGLSVGEDLTLTVKLIATRDEAQKILNQYWGERADILSPNRKYVVTAYRDPYTWEERLERREIKRNVYRVEENTAFDNIINKHYESFFSNDLKALYEKGDYKNEHRNWHHHYNSTLVVPICYKSDIESENVLYYGVLAIDSKNPNGHDLFNDNITFNMLAHSADALAIMLGHLDILQLMIKRNGQETSS